MDEFIHDYEMESLSLGITARKDRDDENESKDDASDKHQSDWRLVLAGNSRECFRNRVRNIHVVALSAAVLKSKFAGIRVLDLSYNRLGEVLDDAVEGSSSDEQQHAHDERKYLLDVAPCLGRMLQSTALYTSTIDELVLSGNRLGGESCRLLCAALRDSSATALRKLRLNSNPLGVAGGHAIAELLASRECTLEELDVGSTELEVENLIAIAAALRTNASVQVLNLDNPVVKTKEEEAIQHIGKMLQVNETLRSISLAKHKLTDDGAQVLAERLLDNHTLQCLVLRANLIGATGASALAALVLQHDALAQLDLSANRIGDVGADAFAHVLQRNCSNLATLALCSTYLTDRGLAAIADACLEPETPNTSHLQSLLLWGNDFGPTSAARFLALCEEGGRFYEHDVETDFVPRRALDSDGADCVHVAHKEVVRAGPLASPKRADAHAHAHETFSERAERARHEIAVIHDVVMASHIKAQLRTLRLEASKPDLWDDSTHAAAVVQQLGALEAREARVSDLHTQFLDTKALHALASDEHDDAMMCECMESMSSVLADAKQLRIELLLSSESDMSSCFIEIQAGAGGTDSCDWAAMLARMYARWADARAFRVQYVSESPGEEAGFRSVCLRVDGSYAYGWAKTEAGVHRLVRVSPFDSAARRHTSFAQVRVYPFAAMSTGGGSKKDVVSDIPSKDLRVDTFRSSGAGGQHVNTTDSAIRITHLPTGIVVQSQSDRSQHRNKAEAMDMLRAKLYQRELDKRAQAKQRFTQGLGENAWGNQIRSYVLHPYKMVKDHRTNVAVTDTKAVLDGDIDRFMEEVLVAQAGAAHRTDDDAAQS